MQKNMNVGCETRVVFKTESKGFCWGYSRNMSCVL